jgi:hypothetical protein
MGFAVLCQLASTLQAFYVVSVRRLARLHSGFLQTIPHGPPELYVFGEPMA